WVVMVVAPRISWSGPSGIPIEPVRIGAVALLVIGTIVMWSSDLPRRLGRAWLAGGVVLAVGLGLSLVGWNRIMEVGALLLGLGVAVIGPGYVLLLDRTSSTLGMVRDRTARRAVAIAKASIGVLAVAGVFLALAVERDPSQRRDGWFMEVN